MKTMTEFPAVNLKGAAKMRSDLIAGGKTLEELPQALGEALKLEGDRLNFLLNALEVIHNRLEDLKRVVVFSLNEGEKAPHGALQKGEHYYLVEHYLPLQKKGAPRGFEKGKGKGDKRRGRRGKGGRGRRSEGGQGDLKPGERRFEGKRGDRNSPKSGP